MTSDPFDLEMPHILLSRATTDLEAAVLSAIPDAEVDLVGLNSPRLDDGEILCFIDWLLDEVSGLELCRRIRADHADRSIHITMIIDGADQSSRARAIAAGADDYIPGPLTPEVLVHRLQHYLGRASSSRPHRFSVGLTVDPDAHQVWWNGRLVVLRPNEFRLLQVFMGHANRLLSRNKIIELLGKDKLVIDERTVDVWVGRLRRQLEASGATGMFRTVRSMGYVLDTPEI